MDGMLGASEGANELRELMQLMNKRCKNTGETSLIVLEIDRRKMLIAEVGVSPPGDDVTTSVLLAAMDPSTRSHVSSKLNMEELTYPPLRQAVMAHCTLQSNNSRSSGPVAMDIGSIGSVADETGAPPQGNLSQEPEWSYDEFGWPVDEQGWQVEGYFDQLNFVATGNKGGKGKGKIAIVVAKQVTLHASARKRVKGKARGHTTRVRAKGREPVGHAVGRTIRRKLVRKGQERGREKGTRASRHKAKATGTQDGTHRSGCSTR